MKTPLNRFGIALLLLILTGTFPAQANSIAEKIAETITVGPAETPIETPVETPIETSVETSVETSTVIPVAERHRYNIAFLWFSRIATAELSLQPTEDPDLWEATLAARTRGVAAWVTSDRAQSYTSLMRWEEDGRLTALRHDSVARKTEGRRERVRLKSYIFDHEQRRVVEQTDRDGRQSESVSSMPETAPNDILTAFFNVRLGVYGPLEAGHQYRIPTFSRHGPSEIMVDVLGADERPRSPRFPDGGVLLAVEVDQDVFDTNDGLVYVWFDDQDRPAQVVVQNVIGLGDVRSTLREN